MSYYVLLSGPAPGLYENWNNCKKAMSGIINPICKYFTSLEEAKDFLKSKNIKQTKILDIETIEKNSKVKQFACTEKRESLLKQIQFDFVDSENKVNSDTVILYTDGSFNDITNKYGYGVVILDNNFNKIDEIFGSGNEPRFLTSRNIAGEVIGALEGLKWALNNNYKNVILYHDYNGISKWANFLWKTKSPISSYYISEYLKYRDSLNIKFISIKGHSNNKFNDRADILAKQGAAL